MAQMIVGHVKEWNSLLHLANDEKLPSSMAFVGPKGIGKSLIAKALAEKLECMSDLIWIEPSGEMIKVDQVHEVLKKLSLKNISKTRIVVFNDAEKLNPQSSNALLKALEEPPENTHFILITQSLSQLLPTIRSRVQSFRFFPLETKDLRQIAPDAPEWALTISRGQISELEDWQSEDLTALLEASEKAFHALGQKDLDGWLELFPHFKDRAQAIKLSQILQFLFRDLVKAVSESEQSLPFSSRLRSSFEFDEDQLARAWEKAFELQLNLVHNGDRTLLFQNFFYDIHHR
jgi:DNA polymerase III subunit delta'